jgi:hypothetical protein
MPRITVHDWEKWGQLIKTWVKNPNTRPLGLQELKAQVEGPANIATVPDNITDLLFMPLPDAENVLVIWLPTKKVVEDTENRIRAGEFDPDKYPLPSFYKETFGEDCVKRLTSEKFEKFNAERVGEYTIQECQ